ncbi:hypothetical protein M569_09371, partial [Genlisea aurea]
CWGCGLRIVVSGYAPVIKCSWCGAITKQKIIKDDDDKWLKWRWFRDRCFVAIIVLFMMLFICGGIWAVYPIVFSVSYLFGVTQLTIATILSILTLSSFSLAAFRPAGSPPAVVWGSYPAVEKGGLENHTFCHHCVKPKPPRAHHCRSCGTCILDMDHHCPFIGNCVGAANHRSFILFLIFTVLSTVYIVIMASFSLFTIWPDKSPPPVRRRIQGGYARWVFGIVEGKAAGLLNSAVLLPVKGLVLVYMFMCSLSVGSGLSVLLWQQLSYVYAGKTYLSQLSGEEEEDEEEASEKGWRNLYRFFG